ncbi:hypothetical protein [Streptomyces scabichelini]|uniref:hypothetical protein n=1 Tax=Streptomyces scabichelini TaxID=2711217 RepID=UPI0030B9D45A
MKGAGSGVDELLGDVVGVDPADLGMLARFSGSPVHSLAAKTTVRKLLGASTPQAPWMMCATLGIDLRNLVGPPQLAAQARAMELIDAVVDPFRETQRANAAYTQARDALDTYLAEHPDIREEADVMVSTAMAEASAKHLLEAYGPPPSEHHDEADTSDKP